MLEMTCSCTYLWVLESKDIVGREFTDNWTYKWFTAKKNLDYFKKYVYF